MTKRDTTILTKYRDKLKAEIAERQQKLNEIHPVLAAQWMLNECARIDNERRGE